ncbi:TonB-dependent receptor [Exilibacterium tricleocarpae]|uniref:TonB-dependent receptor n=1 Tax=Exilibacterium tricleocarpae TaxID=2591008 RepID=A0A545TFR1_9GAMM|nr:TonB-dependent receptor [Exilibacterium tricleocarpae]TQV76038.1 TonB-dependent receptor [Exilibacterium tricleocarpae]
MPGWVSTKPTLRHLSSWRLTLCITLLCLYLNSARGVETDIRFDIAAQPLPQALAIFAEQAGLQSLLYAQKDVQNKQSQALAGSFDVDTGLILLLQNSGLGYREVDTGIIVIDPDLPLPAPALAEGNGVETGITPVTSVDTLEERLVMEEVVSVGTRVKGRTATETVVPVDILRNERLLRAGPELGVQLQSLAPAFNFSRTTVSDGTDIVRPATLRGLNPDQLLVLINGKRRHRQAQINIQQVVGRGSSGTDINAIPASAIERIEILRDGAAAQYGSDAIAGVINIVLKADARGTDLVARYGRTRAGDGGNRQVSLSSGVALGEGGGISVSVERHDRGETNRAGVDSRFDPPRVSMRIGDAESDYHSVFINGSLLLDDTNEAYLFGGVSRRDALSAGFYRGAGARPDAPPVSARYVPELYPQGFLPLQTTEVDDDYLTLGLRGEVSSLWDFDSSLTYGENNFTQGTRRSVNVSLGTGSPLTADNGRLQFKQLSLNLDLNGRLDFEWPNTVFVATGFEYRKERYRVHTGDFASYAYGPGDDFSIFIPSPLDPCPTEPGPAPCADGSARDRAQAGMQAFPGFRAGVNRTRDNFALYIDMESNLSSNLLMGVAGRFERYGDVGANVTGKLSFRHQWLPELAVRGAISTGFRAPGLNQRAFTHTLTNIGPDVLTDTLHAAEGSPALEALGVPALEEERSTHASLGLVWVPSDAVTVTLDAYRIGIRDGVVMTDVIAAQTDACAQPADCYLGEVLASLNQNIGAVQFFANAVDSTTEGIDFVAHHLRDLGGLGVLDIHTALHYNKTELDGIQVPATIDPDAFFSQAQIDLIETGQPRQRATVGVDWRKGRWRSSLRFNRYGRVRTSYFTEVNLRVDVPGGEDLQHNTKAEWLLDVDLSYRFGNGLTLALGANNALDVFPDELEPGNVPGFISGGSFVYPWESSPFGINGAFYYGRIAYRL